MKFPEPMPEALRKLIDNISAEVAKLDDADLVGAALNCAIAGVAPEYVLARFHDEHPECKSTFTERDALMSAAITAHCVMAEMDKRIDATNAAKRAKMN